MPSVDPECEQELTETDKQSLDMAFMFLNSTFTDSIAAQQCNEMSTQFIQKLEAGEVFRGRTDSGDDGHQEHFGAYDPNTGHIHFDPSYIDNVNANRTAELLKDLLNTALHEAAHSLGKYHGDGVDVPPYGPQYSDPYFNRLSPGLNSCIQY